MKTKAVSLAMCVLFVTLTSSVFAGGQRGNPRPIQRPAAREAAKALANDGSSGSGSVMSGSLFRPSQGGAGGMDQFKGLFDKAPGSR